MGTYTQKATDVQAWYVGDLLERAKDWNDIPDIIESYHNEGRLTFHPEKNEISIEIRGEVFDAPKDYWIVYNHGFFEAVTDKFFEEQFLAGYPEQKVDQTSFGAEELKNRFGTHKATIEGPNPSAQIHANLREVFLELAIYLDVALPHNRAKSLAMTQLEDASMWAHKTLAADQPLDV